MQAYGRFVEDVKHAGEARTDLRREPDSLGFATGKRRPLAGERQVIEADIDQERQAIADLPQHFAGHAGLLSRWLPFVENAVGIGERFVAEFAE